MHADRNHLVADLSFQRDAFYDGVRTLFPLSIPGIPFGFVIGVLIADEELLPSLTSWSASFLIFAGSSQLAALTLLADSASAFIVISTVFLINSRHLMYSAAIRDRYGHYSKPTRWLLAYLLVDQQFAVVETDPALDSPTDRYRLWHFLGGGSWLWVMWQATTGLGVLLGGVIKEEWGLSFAVPLLFIGLLILSVKNRPGILAAAVGGTVAVATRNFPQGSGLLLAITLGVAAGGIADTRAEVRT